MSIDAHITKVVIFPDSSGYLELEDRLAKDVNHLELHKSIVLTWKWDEKLTPTHPNKGWAIAWGLVFTVAIFAASLISVLAYLKK